MHCRLHQLNLIRKAKVITFLILMFFQNLVTFWSFDVNVINEICGCNVIGFAFVLELEILLEWPITPKFQVYRYNTFEIF